MDDVGTRDTLASARIAALTEHYQKTYELVLHFWERRNRQFLILAGVLAVAAMASILQEALIAGAKEYLNTLLQAKEGGLGQTSAPRQPLSESVPLAYDVLITFLMVATFYLMANLYHRSGGIIRYYVYLGMLEREIRDQMQLRPSQPGFTREGSFYKASGAAVTGLIRWTYKLVLFSLLVLFFVSRILIDWPHDLATLVQLPSADIVGWIAGNFLFLLDVLLFALTLLLFLGYATLGAPSEEAVRQAIAKDQT